jgi:hypothetical protein
MGYMMYIFPYLYTTDAESTKRKGLNFFFSVGIMLEKVKQGLEALRKQTEARKSIILAHLNSKEPAERTKVTAEDEKWLDGEANLVDEEMLVQEIDEASDCECGVGRLDEKKKTMWEKLVKLGGGAVKVLTKAAIIMAKAAEIPSKKRKRVYHLHFYSLLRLIPLSSGAKNPKPSTLKAKTKTNEPAFTKKENATLEQQIEILDWHYANGKNQTKTAKHFTEIYPNLKLKQPRISDWLKNEQRRREEYTTATSSCHHKQV